MTDKEVKPLCENCKHWGEGDGTGLPYDAGAVAYCKHPSISGRQHPSYGVSGERKTMLYVENLGMHEQSIMTRWDFGCNQFGVRNFKKEKR